MNPVFQIFGVPEDGRAEAAARARLDRFFNGDMAAARACQEDYKRLLDLGDSDAESGDHLWCEAEARMVESVYAVVEVNETKWAGVTVMWT